MAGQTQTPYIGSRISLISKSEIRYEGILYTVDTKESTIALAKVKSFGTEDRPTEHPVQGRDEIYEYIIFKASDIKDLMVCETPKPVPQLVPGLPYDPAIIQVSQVQHPTSSSMPSAPSMSPAVKPITTSGSSSRSNTPQHRLSRSPVIDVGVQAPSFANRAPGAGRQQRPRANERRDRDRQEMPQRQAGGFGRGGGFRGNARDVGAGPTRGQGPPPHMQMSYRNAAMSGGRSDESQTMGFGRRGGFGTALRSNGPTRSHSQGYRGGRGAPRGGAQQLKFDSDYDFEKANEQFQETLSHLKDEVTKVKISDEKSESEEAKKEKDDSGTETQVDTNEDAPLVEEPEPEPEEHDDDFYDKNKSFFDHISCESLERQEGKNNRPNWRREREINTETFGQSAVRNYAYRRGGGRGYGERGGGYGYGYRGYGGRGGGWRGGQRGPMRGGFDRRNYGYNSNYYY